MFYACWQQNKKKVFSVVKIQKNILDNFNPCLNVLSAYKVSSGFVTKHNLKIF